jgi:hypothetical protein
VGGIQETTIHYFERHLFGLEKTPFGQVIEISPMCLVVEARNWEWDCFPR